MLTRKVRDSLMRESFDAKYFPSSSKTTKFRMALDKKKHFIGSSIDMTSANLGTPDHTLPEAITYTINERLGWHGPLTLRINNDLVSNIYIHD